MLMDFSENYRCRFQNESQSAYFDQRQVTVHPFMCYYKEKSEIENSDEENVLVKHSVIAISNDTKHDAFAVKIFENKVLEFLNTKMNNINQIIKFSDGAACQYKGKNTFAHLSKDKHNITHNYFEMSHGKSPCDGLGAVVKNACYNAMISGKAVIGNATDVYEFCKQKLEHDAKLVGKDEDRHISKRNIIYMDASDITREETGAKTLPGTRILHSVRNIGTPFKLQVRHLSCFCKNCCERSHECENAAYVEKWKTVEQKFVSTSVQETDKNESDIAETSMGDGAVTNNSSSKSNKENDRSTNSKMDEDHDKDRFDVNTDDFVLVEISSKRTKKTFVAKVLEVDGDEVNLTYMTRLGNFKFKWPEKEETYWEDIASVKKILSQPSISGTSTNDRLCYEFQNL